MVGNCGQPTLRLKAVYDLDLWCWYLQFRFPGAMNGIKIMNASEHLFFFPVHFHLQSRLTQS